MSTGVICLALINNNKNNRIDVLLVMNVLVFSRSGRVVFNPHIILSVLILAADVIKSHHKDRYQS